MIPPLIPPARPVLSPPHTALPKGACDCHFHIFDAPSSLIEERSYTPPDATYDDYQLVRDKLGFTRSVIVQPSVYGSDNQTTLSVCQSDPNMKAVIVIDETVSDEALQAYADAGAVGCRVNMLFSSGVQINSLANLARRIAPFGWHIQVLTDITRIGDLRLLVDDIAVPVVFDHMGHSSASHGTSHQAFRALLSLLAEGKLWVKLSGAYRLTMSDKGDYSDVSPLIEALVSANPENLVWGTDWPHPDVKGPMPDDTTLLNQILDCLPNSAHRQAIFTDNPARLYGFEKEE